MLTPDEIASRQFLVSLRGYDRDEVERFLSEAAETVASLQRRISELQSELEAARSSLPAVREPARSAAAAPAEVAPQDAFKMLGEETTRILVAAEESARSIKHKAEERAQQELEQARREARDEVESARRTASKVVSEAERRRNQIAEDLRGLESVRDRLAESLREAVRQTTDTMRGLAPATSEGDTAGQAQLAERSASGSVPPREPVAQRPAPVIEPPSLRPSEEPASAATPEPPPPPAPEPTPASEPAATPEPSPSDEPRVDEDELWDAAPEPDDEPVEHDEHDEHDEQLTPAAATPDTRQRREQSLAAIRPGLLRALKRSLQDVQNDVLDALRRGGETPRLDELLPHGDSLNTLSATGEPFLADAYRAGLDDGAQLADASLPHGAADPSRVPARSATFGAVIAHEVTAALRATLAAGIDAGEPSASLSERVGEIFRDLKGPVAEVTVDEHLSRTYGYGTLDAWSALGITAKEWVPGIAPRCPEEMRGQNADAGAVELHAEFPTGQVVPPAHDGCDCTLVPR